MGNSRHIFKFACSEELPFSGNSGNPKIKGVKKVKLVSEDNTKKIEFQGSYFGSYYIFKPDGESNEKFQLFVHRTRDNDIGEEVYLSDPIDLKSIRAKVTLDNQCKYQVALSLGNNEWITLPRSSLSYTNYDNLKKYYNKDLSLSKSGGRDYVMHGQDEVCELAFRSIPVCLEFSDSSEKIAVVMPFNGIRTDSWNFKNYRLVIEGNDSNELSVYLSDQRGIRVRNLEYLNKFLESALLENSNIREVLPELEIDDNVNLDTRQLSCWINNESTIQKIATDEDFKNSVKDLLKSDPEFINSVKGERGPQGLPGEKGEDASPEEVVRKWANDSSKRYILSQEIVKNENFQGAVKYLLKQDSKFKSGVGDVLKSDEGFRDSVKGDSGKSGESPPFGAVAQELIATKANELGQAILNVKHDDREILANNQVLQQGVAAQLLAVSNNRNTLVTEVAGNQDLQNAVADNLKSDTDFKGSVADNSGLRNGVKDSLKNDESFQNYIAQELVTKKADDLGRAVINVKDDNTEVLVNNQVLQQGVAAKLMNDDNRNMLGSVDKILEKPYKSSDKI